MTLIKAAATWLMEGFAMSVMAIHVVERSEAEPVPPAPVRQKPVLRLIVTAADATQCPAARRA